MKILKKFFLVSLFCSFFVVNAKAYTKNDFPDFSSLIGNNNYVISYNWYAENSDGNAIRLTYCKDGSLLGTSFVYGGDLLGGQQFICSSGYMYTRRLYFKSSLFYSFTVQDLLDNKFDFSSTDFSWGREYSSHDFYGSPAVAFPEQKRLYILSDNNWNYGTIFTEYDIYYNDFSNIILSKDLFSQPVEPSYSYTSKVLENGNVELTFTFENYDSGSSYGFTIENEVSGEEYGVVNPFSTIFPNIIPFGDSYSITIPYDTYIYITLAKYNKIEDSTLYFREEIFTDVIDINNIVFSNPSNPYFSIDYQSKNYIQGRFNNTKKGDSCFVKFSNNSDSRLVSCSESFTINYDFNGFLTFYVKRNNDTIYNRNINILGNDSPDYPYISYNVQKQDFYSVVTFNVINDNYDINMSYRYSLDNGVTWTDYQLIDKEPFSYSINVFSNSNVIFEIANVRSPNNIIVYDSKSVYVVLDISTASGLNSSTDNFIDKFISLISINNNLVNYINLLWNNLKNSKLFLIIMIPFISSLICAIIYLIRRK